MSVVKTPKLPDPPVILNYSDKVLTMEMTNVTSQKYLCGC